MPHYDPPSFDQEGNEFNHASDAMRYAMHARTDYYEAESRFRERQRHHRGGNNQCIRVDITVEAKLRETYYTHLIQRIVRIKIEVKWCVGFDWCYRRTRVFQFTAPDSPDWEDPCLKEELRRGEHLYADDVDVNSHPHYDRTMPSPIVISDPGHVLDWLGTDWATAEPVQMQRQLPEPPPQLEDTDVVDITKPPDNE